MPSAVRRLLLGVVAVLCSTTNLRRQLGTGRIDGVVTDSMHARPLVGALVFVTPIGTRRGAIRSAVSNDSGRFVFDSLAAGQLLGGLHPSVRRLARAQHSTHLRRARRRRTTARAPGHSIGAVTDRCGVSRPSTRRRTRTAPRRRAGSPCGCGRRCAHGLEPGLVSPADVAAMEFYATSMGAPGNFKSDCGLILIWTKKRRGVELTSPP